MKEKIGLVLEGGGMRGMYTAGVLDTFLENNIEVDGIVGVSAGALFGVNYLSKQKGRAIRYNKKYNRDKEYLGIVPFLKEGNIVSSDYAYRRVPHELDPFDNEVYKASNVPFYAGVTNVRTGRPEYIQVKDVFAQMDVLKASGSMPIVSRPVRIKGKLYLDGAVTDSIPYQWMFRQGYDKVVVVLTRDVNYRKKPFPVKLAKICLKKYPKIAHGMIHRHEMYNNSVRELKKLEKEGKVIVIRPSREIDISKLEKNPEKLQSVYNLGIRDCKRQIETIKQFTKVSL